MSDEEKIEEIKKNVFRHPNAEELHMKRVPKETAKIFKDFANEKFVGDYGFALVYLVDNLLVEDIRFGQIYSILEDHEKKIAELSKKKPANIKRMLSGRTIKTPVNE